MSCAGSHDGRLSIASRTFLILTLLLLLVTVDARRGGGFKVGGGTRGRRPTRRPAILTDADAVNVTFGAILPYSNLKTVRRGYSKRISDAVDKVSGSFTFVRGIRISQAKVALLAVNPSPEEILSNLCDQLLERRVAAILYMTNSEVYGHNAPSAQYLMQLTGYLGIPVIAWNADNTGLQQVSRLRMAYVCVHSLAVPLTVSVCTRN